MAPSLFKGRSYCPSGYQRKWPPHYSRVDPIVLVGINVNGPSLFKGGSYCPSGYQCKWPPHYSRVDPIVLVGILCSYCSCRRDFIALKEQRKQQRVSQLLTVEQPPGDDTHGEEGEGGEEEKEKLAIRTELLETAHLSRSESEAQSRVSVADNAPGSNGVAKSLTDSQALVTNFESDKRIRATKSNFPSPVASGQHATGTNSDSPYVGDTEVACLGHGRREQEEEEEEEEEVAVRKDVSIDTDKQLKAELVSPREKQRDKFTVTRRLQSALKLLESKQLHGTEGRPPKAKWRSSSFTGGMETESQTDKSRVGAGGMGTRSSILGMGLSQASRRALHDELERVNCEEEERRMSEQSKVCSPEKTGRLFSGSFSLPSSPQKSLRKLGRKTVSFRESDSSVAQLEDRGLHCPATANLGRMEKQYRSQPAPVNPKEDSLGGKRLEGVDVKRMEGERGTCSDPQTSSQLLQRRSGELLTFQKQLSTQPPLATHPSRGMIDSEAAEELCREQRVLEALMVSRGKEEVVAQLSRARLSMIMSTEEVSKVSQWENWKRSR